MPKKKPVQLDHPMQPLFLDMGGVIRFKSNKIVEFLYDTSRNKMNELALMNFSQEDQEQFAQLLGYSLSGFEELSYVSDKTLSATAKLRLEVMRTEPRKRDS